MPAAKQFLRTIKEQNINVAQWADHAWNAKWRNSASRLRFFIPDAGPCPTGIGSAKTNVDEAKPPSNRCWALLLILAQWGMAPSAICECGVEGQTADHIIQRCQYLAPNGVHGLQVLDDDTIKWLSTSCPNI